MRSRLSIAVVAIALALPAYPQHGGHGGFSGHGGMTGHPGFGGHPGFSGSMGISQPAPPMRNGIFARPGGGRFAPPARSGFRMPYQGHGVSPNRPSYRPGFGNRNHGRNRDRDHDRFRPRIAYGYGYPGWPAYPYPFVIDPGFYDWGDSGSSDDAQALAPGYAEAPPYGDYGGESGMTQEPAYAQAPPNQAPMARQPYGGSIASSSQVAQEPLTVIFKNGRAPETMQNFMMSTKTLTDLDRQHYEQIPLDQVDVAATEQANRARRVDFKVPAASR